MTRRVMHVTETLDGGLGRFLRGLTRFQAELGWNVTVVAPEAGEGSAELASYGVTHVPWDASPRPDPGVPRELATLHRTVARLDPELVHLHTSKAGFAGRVVVRGGRPTVFQPHGLSFLAVNGPVRRVTLAWERFAVRWADVVLCVSDGERATAEAAGVHARFRVVHNGIDIARFPAPGPGDRERARMQLGLPEGPIVVCIGRLHRSKNQLLLARIWPSVRAAVPDARLVLVGEGPDRGEIEAACGEGIELVGETTDVGRWLAAASLVAQPSTWEGLSLSLLEALACGRSVVVTDVPGMREVVGDRAGAVVARGDEEAVRTAIVERLLNPSKADAEGVAGRAIVEAGYVEGRQLAKICDLYDEVLVAAADRRRD